MNRSPGHYHYHHHAHWPNLQITAFQSLQSREGVNYALKRLEPFSCPEFGLPLASRASRCLALQHQTVYLLHYAPLNCRWAPSSACWRLSFSSMREPSSGAVVTEQRVRRRIQISGLNSTQPTTVWFIAVLLAILAVVHCARILAVYGRPQWLKKKVKAGVDWCWRGRSGSNFVRIVWTL